MRIAVIGAGVAGLTCARELKHAGAEVVVFEKSTALGGRCATRRVGPFAFDTGATSIAPRGMKIEAFLLSDEMADELVKVERPIWTMAYGRVAPGDVTKMKMDRYTFRTGMNALGKRLAQGIDVRFELKLESLERSPNCFEVNGETFDEVVLTMPTPQAAEVLGDMPGARMLLSSRYRRCLSVLLGFDRDIGDLPYHALVEPEQQSPLIWLSLENLKAPNRAPEGKTAMVAQFGASYSQDHYDDSDAEVIREALASITRLYGQDFATPEVAQVKRWRYAQPEQMVSWQNLNEQNEHLWFAGDGLMGPRVEYAFESGIDTARLILQK